MNLKEMLNVIKTAGDNHEREIEDKINKIKDMENRIRNVIAVGYAIFENNLEKDYQEFVCSNIEHERRYNLYADGIYHNVGFSNVRSKSEISLVVRGDDINDKWDLFVMPGKLCYKFCDGYIDKTHSKIDSTYHLDRFIEDFPRLESELFKFVEFLNKQNSLSQ